jgi:DNA polymerase elongation subunit (family B)
MSSLQFYQAIKDDVLIPRSKSIPEAFKSAYDLLVGDRGGMVYEPRVGAHDYVGEVDFSSMYPSIMANKTSPQKQFCANVAQTRINAFLNSIITYAPNALV